MDNSVKKAVTYVVIAVLLRLPELLLRTIDHVRVEKLQVLEVLPRRLPAEVLELLLLLAVLVAQLLPSVVQRSRVACKKRRFAGDICPSVSGQNLVQKVSKGKVWGI